MTSITCPVVVEVPDELLPPGPPGKSAYQTWLDNGHSGSEAAFLDWLRNGQVVSGGVVSKQFSLAPGASCGVWSAYQASGLSGSIDVPAGKKVRVQVSGMVNHTSQNIVHFTIKRGATDLTPANCTGLACARIDIADGVRSVGIDYIDAPAAGVQVYELFWRCHNAGTAYLGRRPIDTAMMVPTTMTLTLVDA